MSQTPTIKQIRIKVTNGTLLVYANELMQDAGIMFIPERSNEEIDLAYVQMTDSNGRPACAGDKNHGLLSQINLTAYGDVYDEDYTYKAVIDTKDAIDAVSEPGECKDGLA